MFIFICIISVIFYNYVNVNEKNYVIDYLMKFNTTLNNTLYNEM